MMPQSSSFMFSTSHEQCWPWGLLLEKESANDGSSHRPGPPPAFVYPLELRWFYVFKCFGKKTEDEYVLI